MPIYKYFNYKSVYAFFLSLMVFYKKLPQNLQNRVILIYLVGSLE